MADGGLWITVPRGLGTRWCRESDSARISLFLDGTNYPCARYVEASKPGADHRWDWIMTDLEHEERRLVRRITHLRTMLHLTEDARIVATVNEFIAHTETALVKLKPESKCNTLH